MNERGITDGSLAALREHVGELQLPQIAHGRRAIILFEGLQGSAKKIALKQLTAAFDPCHVTVHPTAFDRREASEGHWLAETESGVKLAAPDLDRALKARPPAAAKKR